MKLSRKIAVSVTGLYVIISIFFAIMNGRRVDNVSEELLVAGVLWWLVLPMIMIICWYMCMERYLVIEFRKLGEQDTLSKRIWYYISVVILSLTGMAIYQAFKEGISYVMKNKNLLDNLEGCILMKYLQIKSEENVYHGGDQKWWWEKADFERSTELVPDMLFFGG